MEEVLARREVLSGPEQAADLIRAIASFGWLAVVAAALITLFFARKKVGGFLQRVIDEGWVKTIRTPLAEVELRQRGVDVVEGAGEKLFLSAPETVVEIGQAVETDTALPVTPAKPASTSPEPEAKKPDLTNMLEGLKDLRVRQRKATEELIRGAALWGWTMRDESYDQFPDPVIQWEGDRPRIVAFRGGRYNPLEAVARQYRDEARAQNTDDTIEAVVEEMKVSPPQSEDDGA